VAIAVLALLLAIAIVPFVRVPMPKAPAFVPAYEAALFFIDWTTAVLLFDQFARQRSLSMLCLASGYLFDALIIVPHALSFPGGFAPTGLPGGGEQTTAWLYVFWHGGFPLFVIAYALMRRREEGRPLTQLSGATWPIAAAVAGVALIAVALTLLATWGHDWLPIVMQGSNYSLLVSKGISPAVLALTLVAMIALWRREPRVLDLWLMLVMWVWLFDIALSAVVGSTRYDLGFYAGRIFGLIAASFLLITLTVQLGKIYAAATVAAASLEQRLSELVQSRARVAAAGAAAGAGARATETFIQRENIAHYLDLLGRTTADKERAMLLKLLAEEEVKAGRNGPP
jgi:hypothetical protein